MLWGALIGDALAGADAPDPVRVQSVLDGDTVVLADGRHVRLLGINAPELGRDGAADEPLAQAARRRLAGLVQDRVVELRPARQGSDHYGRLLAHLDLPDGRSPAELLLREGLACATARPPELSRLERYRQAEDQARRADRGLWAEPYFRPRQAGALTPAAAGFRFVQGTITRVRRQRHFVVLELSPRFAVLVPREHWPYFGGRPEAWRGRRVLVRGWIRVYQGGALGMKIYHPAMIEPLPRPAGAALDSALGAAYSDTRAVAWAPGRALSIAPMPARARHCPEPA